MANDSLLTKDDLLDVLADFYSGHLKPEFDNINQRFEAVDQRFDGVEEDLNSITLEIRGVRNELKGIKAELSGIVTKIEFNKLKEKSKSISPNKLASYWQKVN